MEKGRLTRIARARQPLVCHEKHPQIDAFVPISHLFPRTFKPIPIIYFCDLFALCFQIFKKLSTFSYLIFFFCRKQKVASKAKSMADWGPVIIAVVLFVLLSPGLLFQIPARGRVIEFGNMQTSGASILVHAIIYFGLITIFLIVIGVHIYTG